MKGERKGLKIVWGWKAEIRTYSNINLIAFAMWTLALALNSTIRGNYLVRGENVSERREGGRLWVVESRNVLCNFITFALNYCICWSISHT